ncbi:hypothetical protein FSST1_002352 [Fusarium sambucinum]
MAGEPPEHQNKWQHVALGGSRWNPVQGLGSLWLSPLLTSKAQGHVWWLKVCYIRPAPDHTHTLGLGAASQNIISRLFWDSCWQHLSPLTTSLPPVNTIQLLRSKSNYQHSTKRLVRDRHDSSRSNPEHIPSRRQWPHPKYAALNPRRDRARALS